MSLNMAFGRAILCLALAFFSPQPSRYGLVTAQHRQDSDFAVVPDGQGGEIKEYY